MVELQLLNTLLFSDNVSNLKKAINTLNNPTNPKQGGLKAEQVKNILSYAVVYNTNLNKEVINKALTEDANKTAKDEEVIKKTLTKAAKKALTEAVKEAKEADKKAKEEDAKEAKEEAVEKTAKNYLISNFTTSKLTEILDEVIKQSFKAQTAFTESVEKAFTESVEKAAKNYLISKFTIFTEAVEKVAKNEESVEKAAKNYPISEFTTSELTKISDEIIKQSFKAQEAKHKFFSPKTVDSQDQQPINSPSFEAAENQYVKAFKFSNLITYIEKGTWDNNIISDDYAYKMLVCFGPENNRTDQTIITNFINFLRTSNFHNFMKEVALPENSEEVTLPKWQKMIQKDGPEALKLFASANRIERFKAQKSVDSHLPPTNIEEARSLYIKSQYPGYDKYPAAAELCYQYNRPNKTFTKILGAEKNKKTTDNIPDIHVDGKDILQTNGKDCAGYHLVKLPIGDPHTYFLGHIVNDCRSIDGIGSEGVKKGITDKNSGFYVLLKSKNGHKADVTVFNEDGEINYPEVEIVGQSYAFRTETDNLIFNSWENLRYAGNSNDNVGDDHIAAQMLKKACNEIIINNCDISRITIGTAGEARTPEELKQNIVSFNELPLSLHYSHINTDRQAVIAQNLKLEEIQNELKKKVPNIEIISIKHGEKLKELLQQPEFISYFNEMFTTNPKLLEAILTYSVVENLSLASLQRFSDPKIINLLTSPNALKVYKLGITLDQLADLDPYKFEVLTSDKAQAVYKLGITFAQLADLDPDKFELLTSYDALRVYKLGITLDQLADLDPDKFELLTSYDVLRVYEDYGVFDQLKDLSIEKIKALTSSNALKAYDLGVTFDQLQDLSIEKIELLTSSKAIFNVYTERYTTADELKSLDLEKIKKLISYDVLDAYKVGATIYQLQDLDIEKIKALTSYNVLMILKQRHTTFTELKDLDIEKIEALTSYNVLMILKQGHTTFTELKDLDIEKIEALTSNSGDCILKVYNKNHATFSDLKELEVKKIKALTSFKALELYENGIKFAQLKDLNAKIIEQLYWKCRICVSLGDEVEQLLTDKIKDLTRHTSEEPESVLFNLQDIDSLKPSEVIIDEVKITGQQVMDAY